MAISRMELDVFRNRIYGLVFLCEGEGMEDKKLDVYEFYTKSENRYIFDNVSGIVVPSSELVRFIIDNFNYGERFIVNELINKFNLNHDSALKEYDYIKNLISLGYFYAKEDEVSFSDNTAKDLLLSSSGSQLILILTEQCNLRCKYCVYSDCYPESKTYSNKKMSFETAKKAIDIYLKLFEEKCEKGFREIPRISFYGGEPFLEYRLMQLIVEYCNKKRDDFQFLVTTNGTILNKEIADMIINNNFNVTFSLDGNKLNHDRNRVFHDGKKSFDEIIKNIELLQELRKKHASKQTLSFACCFDSYSNMEEIVNFFESNEDKFGEYQLLFNEVYKYDTTYYDYCREMADKGIISSSADELNNSIDRIRKKYLDDVLKGRPVSYVLKTLFQGAVFYKYRAQGMVGPVGNSCVPGDKISVDSNGDFYVCEKATQQYKIGDTNRGLDWDSITNLINRFIKVRDENCKGCSVSRLCDLCYIHLIKKDDLEFNNLFCKDKKRYIESTIKTLFSTLEENNHSFEINESERRSYEIK